MSEIDWSKLSPYPEDNATPGTEPEGTPGTEPEVPKYKIKYNHEEQELTVEELTKLAQLGMMYDNKVKPEYETMTSEIDNLAKTFGMSKDEYLQAVKAQAEQYKIQQIQQQAQIPEAVAKEIHESRKFREQIEQERSQQAEKQKMQTMIDDFRVEYPGVTSEQIPAEVWQMVDKGASLTAAYTKHTATSMTNQLAELQKQIEQLKGNNTNIIKTSGAINTSTQTHKDITADTISQMSGRDLVDNFENVKDVLARMMSQ